MSKYTKLINNIVAFGNSDDRIAAIILVGSQARKEKSSDEYSDLDLIVITEDTNYFVQSNDWLDKISKYHILFLEKTADGADEKRVLFEGALDVDFVIISENDARAAFKSGKKPEILLNDYRVLLDKKEMLADIFSLQQTKESYCFPQEADYVNIVNDFWYHAIWTSKKLLRGELWEAKFCLDSYTIHGILEDL
ncbi:aminoglycoside 6-adenylyltransferase [Clostridium boliviensis]|uniref:Aminoglycoside 6-adenylyltransferase n=1 Tax=Clostridium boliviensis TaxID=318465 RepID=A0ABU4GH02_9CLOT|nr:aminoglycoside 6-adenylyltransferase [Clostridium boliviensis]MDW2796901.1 aminoglycoside 6-adenylyltransferase [Clostridium boliviensis]